MHRIDLQFDDLSELQEPPISGELSNQSILHGPLLEPILVLQSYDPDKWERFVAEWAVGCFKNKYETVWKSKGSGDKGRDVVGFFSQPISQSDWDNYQCKHYNSPLAPTDVWIEIGKIVYFSFIGEFKPPKSYKFVAPRGIGAKLLGLLEKPDQIRTGLLSSWPKHCQNELVSGQNINLEAELIDYVSKFNFTIFCL